ncbi:MAG: toll/interleukin-1 receptor domain-containing protein [Actinomycetota bacterium]|nr:toll/interleukin-1 receptor domain-containing protein [Actinomycetota bacterium]
MRVFFSHASEDKPVVEQVFSRIADEFPDVKGWLDRFEISGGDDLLDKLAEGIDTADRFLIFLSERSIDKPWVKLELKKALMAEIEGVKAEFIIPIKLGAISKFPAFIESKYYIDLQALTEEEWLNEIHAAISGVRASTNVDLQQNLEIQTQRVSDDPSAIAVVFNARYWAEPVSFRLRTTQAIAKRQYQLLPPQRGGTLNYALQEHERAYAVALPHHRISPSQRFAMLLKFPPGTDLDSVIEGVERWDGSDSTQSGMAFLA